MTYENICNEPFLLDTLTEIPNAKGFEEYCKDINTQNITLAAFNISVKEINKESRKKGDACLKALINEFKKQHYKIFRIQGEKFNIVFLKDEFDFKCKQRLQLLFDVPVFQLPYIIYYGILTNDGSNFEIFRHRVIEEMYRDRNRKMQVNKIEAVVKKSKALLKMEADLLEQEKNLQRLKAGKEKKLETIVTAAKSDKLLIHGKEITPDNFKETDTQKFLAEMYFATATVNALKDGKFTSFTLYVFPTKLMPALVTLPNIVIIDTGINYTAYKDCNHFTYMDVEYNVSMRFTREGKLNFSIFPTDETVKNNINIHIQEGLYTPDNFGKIIHLSDGDIEIYPIKQNIRNLYDFGYIKDNEIIINKNGFINDNGKNISVTMDDISINLTVKEE